MDVYRYTDTCINVDVKSVPSIPEASEHVHRLGCMFAAGLFY